MLRRTTRRTFSVLLLAAAATAAGVTPIVISTLVYEPLTDVRDLVANILKFTEPSTTLVLHLNARQHYRNADLAVLRAMGGDKATSRVLVNPERLAVTWGDGQCQAFLSSANHYARVRPPRSGVDPIVVWLDSNMMFFRPCVERYLRRAQCTSYDRPMNKVPWKAGPESARKFLTRNGSSPVVIADHEGSFFPLSLLLEIKGGLTTRGGAMPRFARWAENLIFSTYSLGNPNCTGARITRWIKTKSGYRKHKEVLVNPRENEFAYKRVPRTLEIEKGCLGTEIDGLRHDWSQNINRNGSAAACRFFVEPPGRTCGESKVPSPNKKQRGLSVWKS